ncbi:MAG: hypothetical protein AB9873_20005 [Syntrophobacteraceae bacterium]
MESPETGGLASWRGLCRLYAAMHLGDRTERIMGNDQGKVNEQGGRKPDSRVIRDGFACDATRNSGAQENKTGTKKVPNGSGVRSQTEERNRLAFGLETGYTVWVSEVDELPDARDLYFELKRQAMPANRLEPRALRTADNRGALFVSSIPWTV